MGIKTTSGPEIIEGFLRERHWEWMDEESQRAGVGTAQVEQSVTY